MTTDPSITAQIISWFTKNSIGVLAGIVLTQFVSAFYEFVKHLRKRWCWRKGLLAELGKVYDDIIEAKREISAGRAYTKRLNSDFLESSRLAWCECDSRVTFLALLSNAYRDIVHTNGMLDRLEECKKQELLNPSGPKTDPAPVITSLRVTGIRVGRLRATFEQKTKCQWWFGITITQEIFRRPLILIKRWARIGFIPCHPRHPKSSQITTVTPRIP